MANLVNFWMPFSAWEQARWQPDSRRRAGGGRLFQGAENLDSDDDESYLAQAIAVR